MTSLSNVEHVSGIKINTDKTKVIKIGGWRYSRIIHWPKHNLIWAYKFKSLGIEYDTSYMDHITKINLKGMKEIRRLINICTPRNLTLFGKITLIKILSLKVTYILLSHQNPKIQTLQEIDSLLKLISLEKQWPTI